MTEPKLFITGRLAVTNDLSSLLEIEQSAFPEARWASESTLALRLELTGAETWIAFVDELSAGFSNGFPIGDRSTQEELDPPDRELYLRDGQIWLLRNVAVRPSCRRRGIGQMLIERQVDAAKRHGARKLRFTATENLTGYYRKLGFRKIREAESFHGVLQAVWEASG